ncbi:MAG: hypothetical protein KC413_19820, partial [Anaerolineales bacterium]|nr:hypothetical protein [Anaerolineales bacterium]
MPATYTTPGVYVEEVDKGSKPIEAAGASMAAFVGITAEASVKAIDPATGERIPVESVLNKATLVTNWTQFQNIFGGFTAGAYLPDAVYGYFSNGGGACYITSIMALSELSEKDASIASATIPPSRGKSKVFTVSAKQAGVGGNDLSVTIKADEKGETFAMSVGGETKSGLTMKKGEGFVGDAEFSAVTLSDLGSSMPADGTYQLSGGGTSLPSAADFIGDVAKRTGLAGLEALDDVRLVLCPDLMVGYDGSDAFKERVKAVQTNLIADCERLKYRFAVLDTPPGLNAQQAKEWREYVNYDTS